MQVVFNTVIDQDIDALKALLEAGYDPVEYDKVSRVTPMHHAAMVGRTDIMQLLFDHGAYLQCHSRAGVSPLMEAAHYGQVSSVVWILETFKKHPRHDNYDCPSVRLAREIAYQKQSEPTLAPANAHATIVELIDDFLQNGESPSQSLSIVSDKDITRPIIERKFTELLEMESTND